METELCKIAYKYGTDKCPQIAHPYTPFYYELLKGKKEIIKKVIEVGIGSKEYMHFQPKHYMTGASLKMWRDFFPNANIFGVDIDQTMMFEENRIQTFLCNELNKEDLENLIKKTGRDIDLFIDDGLHTTSSQIFLCKTIMPLLKKDVIYVIEDVGFPNAVINALNNYNCVMPRLKFIGKLRPPKNRIIVVSNKI